MGLGPFDLTGGPFLALYAGLFGLAVITGIVVPRWFRPEGRPTIGLRDADRLAYLAGGATRFGEALIARLFAIGALATDGSKLMLHAQRAGQGSAERAVLALASPATWPQVTRAIAQDAAAIDRALVDQGLLIDRAMAWRMRLLQTAPYFVLLLFGAIKWGIGTLREKPVGILTVFLIITAVVALIRFAKLDRNTKAGLAALQDMRLQSDRLRRAPTPEEAGLAVALFGTVVLAGSPWATFHTLRSPSDSNGSSSSSDGGSCGGGGGGCGGCGS
jgi:uncharacterized protein (TIGR04222 family)